MALLEGFELECEILGKGYELPYVHCRAHILSLAVNSSRNKCAMIKRVLYVVKEIYNVFHYSPERELILHEIETVLQESFLRILEAVGIRYVTDL